VAQEISGALAGIVPTDGLTITRIEAGIEDVFMARMTVGAA
jgi:hypothetical protein